MTINFYDVVTKMNELKNKVSYIRIDFNIEQIKPENQDAPIITPRYTVAFIEPPRFIVKIKIYKSLHDMLLREIEFDLSQFNVAFEYVKALCITDDHDRHISTIVYNYNSAQIEQHMEKVKNFYSFVGNFNIRNGVYRSVEEAYNSFEAYSRRFYASFASRIPPIEMGKINNMKEEMKQLSRIIMDEKYMYIIKDTLNFSLLDDEKLYWL